jgi:hypothetical protein
LAVRAELTRDELTPAEVQVLRGLVEGPGAPGGRTPMPPTMPDVQRYELVVRLGGGEPRTLVYTDLDLPGELRPLVSRLNARAHPDLWRS